MKKAFRIEDYPSKTVIDIGNKMDFEIFRNVLKLNGKDYEIEWEDIFPFEDPFRMGFNFNNMKWAGYAFLHGNGYQVLNFEDFDWDKTLLELYGKEFGRALSETNHLIDKRVEIDKRIENGERIKEKCSDQIEFLKAKIREKSRDEFTPAQILYAIMKQELEDPRIVDSIILFMQKDKNTVETKYMHKGVALPALEKNNYYFSDLKFSENNAKFQKASIIKAIKKYRNNAGYSDKPIILVSEKNGVKKYKLFMNFDSITSEEIMHGDFYQFKEEMRNGK